MLEELKNFLKLTHSFREVQRDLYYPNSERKENDSEHSYQLALVTWYIISSRKFPLDQNLAIKYALVHDLVEAYAGDVWFYRSKKEDLAKKKREEEARKKLEKQFPEFRDLHFLIDQYEKQATKESQFVYALDKFLPILNSYIDGGRIWKEKGVTINQLIEQKGSKIKVSPEISKYFELLLKDLKDSELKMFGKGV